MSSLFYSAKDIMELIGVSESQAYKLIRIMNSELERDGYLTVRGKVPARYARERFSLEECVNERAE